MNILLTNVYDLFNLGEVALVTSLVKNLHEPKFRIASLYSFLDEEICQKLGVKIVGQASPRPAFFLFFWFTLTLFRAILWSILHKLFNIHPNFLLNRELKAYLESDLIVDLGGDNFSDESGFGGSLIHGYSLLLAILLDKPFIICSQSIGPFKTYFTKSLAKYIMSKASLITVREPITLRYLLNDLGLKMDERLYMVPDLAFLLEETDYEETQRFLMEKGIPIKMPIVCVNPSQLISKHMFSGKKTERYELYTNLMAEIVDYLPSDTVVLLLPNVIGRPIQVQGPFKNVDDRLAMKAVFEKLKDKSKVYLIEDVGPHYIKGIFGLADLFIGCRMHAIISALSAGCPTVALSYSHKTLGVVGELMGLKEFVVNVRHRDDLDSLRSELFVKIDDTWEKRALIKDMLRGKSGEWKQLAMMNIELMRQCPLK